MESPRNHGGSEEEEYSSCESGWTMYIEDAFIGNDRSSIVVDDEEDHDDDSQVKEADDGGDDEESDDSMASDASSGPSNQLPKNINKHATKKNVSETVYLQQRQHTEEKTLSNKGGEKSERKDRTRTSGASHVQSGGKVNKTK